MNTPRGLPASAAVAVELVDTSASVSARVVAPAVVHIMIAADSVITGCTNALVAVQLVHTRASVGARTRCAIVRVDRARRALVSGGAHALDAVHLVHARRLVLTRRRQALVHVRLAEGAPVAWCAHTTLRTARLDARRAVFARVRTADVSCVGLGAVSSGVASVASAFIVADQVCTRAVHTGVRAAFIHHCLAAVALEAGLADAFIALVSVDANSVVQTRVTGAVVDVRVASLAAEPSGACAFEVVRQIDAGPPIVALACAVVHI